MRSESHPTIQPSIYHFCAVKRVILAVFGYFSGTENGTSEAGIKILRPLFNTNTPLKPPFRHISNLPKQFLRCISQYRHQHLPFFLLFICSSPSRPSQSLSAVHQLDSTALAPPPLNLLISTSQSLDQSHPGGRRGRARQ